MIWLLIFLGIGVGNVAAAWLRGTLMLRSPGRHRAGSELLTGLVEVAFFLLFWWVQLAFWMVVRIHAGTGWVLARLMGEKHG